MINTAKALEQFYSSFGLRAYLEDNVPDDVKRPYITYQLVETEWDQPATHYARIWYHDTGMAAILQVVDLVKDAISSGARIPCEGGCVVIRQGTPFAQIQNEEDPADKYAYLNMQINCYHV